jgi:hypothetical protein
MCICLSVPKMLTNTKRYSLISVGEFHEVNDQGIQVAMGSAPASFGVVTLTPSKCEGLSKFEARTYCETWLLYGSEVRALSVAYPVQVAFVFATVRQRIEKAESAVAKSGKHNKFAKMTDIANNSSADRGPKGNIYAVSIVLSQHTGSVGLSQHAGSIVLSQHAGSIVLSQHAGSVVLS